MLFVRVARSVSLIVVVFVAVSVSAFGDDLREREVGELVTEYVFKKTGAKRRSQILLRLRSVDPVLAKGQLVKSIKDEVTRPQALDLALALRVEGLFSHVKALVDTVDEDRVTDLLMATGGKGVFAYLFGRWSAAQPEERTYLLVRKGFLAYPIAKASDIRRFVRLLTSKVERVRRDAAAILAFQLGLPVADVDSVKAKWSAPLAEFKLDSKPRPRYGIDLLRSTSDESSGIRWVGPNVRVGAGGSLVIKPLPRGLQRGNWTVRAWVKVKRGDGASVGIQMNDRQIWNVEVKKGEWVVRERLGAEDFAKAKLGRWILVEFSWVDESGSSSRYERVVSISVDGVAILKRGKLNGVLTAVFFSGGAGEIVVGATGSKRSAK